MRHHDSDPHDALNDYLDSLAGAPPADSRAGNLDPDLRDGVDRFFDLAEQAGMDPRASTQPRRSPMSTNLTLPASGAPTAPSRRSHRRRSLLRWTEHMHVASTALLIATVAALAVALFGANGIGRNGGEGGKGEPSGNLAAVPMATVEPEAETSSIPYPTADECTIEITRDEVVAHIQAATTATEPVHERYEQAIEPSAEDAQAIMQTFREWQACSVGGINAATQLELQTPWFTANTLPVFFNYETGTIERPISEEEIQEYANFLMDGDDPLAIAQVTAVAATPPAMSEKAVSDRVPVPANATPIDLEGGWSYPTIFAEDIVMVGPDTAVVQAYMVNETTAAVQPATPMTYTFARVDGQWLIDSYREGVGG
jgi:hypothetical protein